jgi:hypothetical protein
MEMKTVISKDSFRYFSLKFNSYTFSVEFIKENIIKHSENFNTADIEPISNLVYEQFRDRGIENAHYSFTIKSKNEEFFIFMVCINLTNE